MTKDPLLLFNLPVESYIFLWFLTTVLTPRYEKKKMFIYTIVAYIAVIAIIFVLVPVDIIRVFLNIAALAVITCRLFTDGVVYKLLCCMLYLLTYFLLEGAFSFAIIVTTGVESPRDVLADPLMRIAFLACYYLLGYCMLKVVSFFLRKQRLDIPQRQLLPFMFLPIMEVLLVTCLYITMIVFRANELVWFLLVVIVLAYIAVLMLFQSLKTFLNAVHAQERYRFLERQQQIQLEHYTALQQQILDTQKMRHDIKNHLLTLRRLLEQKQYDRAEQYFQNLGYEFENIPQTIYCENQVVNALLYNKVAYAQTHWIEMDIKINLKEKAPFETVDLIGLISNLLDNAIEAVLKLPANRRHIVVRDHMKGDFYVIKFENDTDLTSADLPSFETTKEDRSKHGFGLQVVDAVVQKYNGSLQREINGGMFSAVVLLNCPQSEKMAAVKK